MADPQEMVDLRRAVESALIDLERAERYRHAQAEARRPREPAPDAHPLEYDEAGFPVDQPAERFVRRVARLLRA